jgi:hypothetical protein
MSFLLFYYILISERVDKMKNNIFEFKNFFYPPEEYGIVSFYWWVGEELKKDRLLWQLEQLTDMDICGLQINYCHTDEGGNTYGLPYKSKPKQFSDEWWDLFSWFLKESEKRGISVSVSDYTLGSAGQGYYIDEIICDYPYMRGSTITYNTHLLSQGKKFIVNPNNHRISLFAYPIDSETDCSDSLINISDMQVFNADGYDYKIVEIEYQTEPFSIDPMHKNSGTEVVKRFFQRFEDNNHDKCGKALNFFFSDELSFGISGNLWNDNFKDEFINRKGYDIIPYLYGIFEDIGPITQKIRLDYYDVIVSLEEKNYFEPIYTWHEERGMTYGCDHGGRGYDVTEFGDYFRTQKYNQGPGNDQPNLSSDIIKNKISSSISHIYSRPRTWLEGFYGSGWGTSSAQLIDAICRNYAMGHNLLSFHGLYYTTYGGFWEWAPPCNHFRMPYWIHMKKLTKCVKRMSYMNTRGVHQCDVAIIYPVAAVEGGIDGEKSVQAAFSLGEFLYKNGVDFDFIDFESLANAEISYNKLSVANKNYKTVIIPSMKTIRFSGLEKLLEFKQAGGVPICFGDVPVASDRAGRNDNVLNDIVNQIFDSSNILAIPQQVLDVMDSKFTRDFKVIDSLEIPYFQHRKTDDADFYTVYGIAKGTKCFFRVHGNSVLLDSMNSSVYKLNVREITKDGTIIALPLDYKQTQTIMFSNDDLDFPEFVEYTDFKILPLKNEWQCKLIPSMDNTFGDFSLPAHSELIGAQIRRPTINNKKTTIGFGPYFKVSEPISPSEDINEIERKLLIDPETSEINFSDYVFSMRYGREGDPGHQGWHGLKGKITDEFITLGKQIDYHNEYRYEEEISNAVYYMYTYVYSNKKQRAKILTGTLKPEKVYINGKLASKYAELINGFNQVIIKFPSNGRTYFIIEKENPTSFVQETPLAMSWYNNPNILSFDINKGQNGNNHIRFMTPPAFRKMFVHAKGDIIVKVDGIPAVCKKIHTDKYEINTPIYSVYEQNVEMTILSKDGLCDGASLYEYIDFICDIGVIKTGDWGHMDGLENYSGGISYSQSVILPEFTNNEKFILSLGEVVSTAQIIIGNKLVGTLVSPPFEIDITAFVSQGENTIEIIVYNTLYNHYKTIPSKYNPEQKSGLIGPAEIRILRMNIYENSLFKNRISCKSSWY